MFRAHAGSLEVFMTAGWLHRKGELTIPDRSAVIAYVHTLSGHQGPQTPNEQLGVGGGHGGH